MYLQQQQSLIKGNNLNLIRLFLSATVLVFHCYELNGKECPEFINRLFNGERAVQVFFIISGYLIIKSYRRSSGISAYFTKRLKRIVPAYSTIILLCAVLGVFVSSLGPGQYFSSPQLYKYAAVNLLFLNFLQPDLPGVFEHNFISAVNGSLWTLKVEVGYYLIVPVLFSMQKKLSPGIVYVSLFLLSALYFYFFTGMHSKTGNSHFLFLSRQLPGQLYFFLTGALLTELEKNKYFLKTAKWTGLPCILAVPFLQLPLPVSSIMMGLGLFFTAFVIPEIKYPFYREDISYGLYIYHFPVIQVLVMLGIYHQSFLLGFALSFIITFLFAVLSWLWVEKPFISHKSAVLPEPLAQAVHS